MQKIILRPPTSSQNLSMHSKPTDCSVSGRQYKIPIQKSQLWVTEEIMGYEKKRGNREKKFNRVEVKGEIFILPVFL